MKGQEKERGRKEWKNGVKKKWRKGKVGKRMWEREGNNEGRRGKKRMKGQEKERGKERKGRTSWWRVERVAWNDTKFGWKENEEKKEIESERTRKSAIVSSLTGTEKKRNGTKNT